MIRAFHWRPIARGCRIGALCALALAPRWAGASPIAGAAAVLSADPDDQLSEIVVEGRGPRFVAPTRRDSIGRIWAPVYINGRGPFRLVLDTGATQSAITRTVASILGLSLDQSPPLLLRGVTGVAKVPTVQVQTLSVGDLTVNEPILPIVPDAMGGADGILGTAGLFDKRVRIDFRHDLITITYSRNQRPGRGFEAFHFKADAATPIIIDADVGGVPAKAIIDTGGQLTIANLALRNALSRSGDWHRGTPDTIAGATLAIQDGEIMATPAIDLGSIQIVETAVTYSDLMIFSHWQLLRKPAILVGMDALGLLDSLVIDYKEHELDMRIRSGRPHGHSDYRGVIP